jgi:phosphate:Na+ symporter
MDWWQIILRIMGLLGALGLFLFGMKTMSEALQRIAGKRVRNIMSRMTSKKFKGVLSGFLITGVAQSSSAITVMIVTFVNAGLISLTQSVPLIMGANIGTTVTAWMVSVFGFTLSIQQLYLPLIGVSLILLLSAKPWYKVWGEFLIGLGILFIGLQFLRESVPDFSQYPETLAFLSSYTKLGYLSVILFTLIGMIITMLIQSSSATITLFLVLCYNGSVSFELATAMVLGANIGTTVTANLAAIITNQTAKRAARIHFLFNLTGVLWFLILFRPLINLIDLIVIRSTGHSLLNYDSSELIEIQSIMPLVLSGFHTFFNFINTLVQVNFIPILEKLSGYLVLKKEDKKEAFSLRYLSTGLSSTSEIAIVQVKMALALYGRQIVHMFNYIPELLLEKEDTKYSDLLKKISAAEERTDQMETEITDYLTMLAEAEVSLGTSRKIKGMLTIAAEMEQMGDDCFTMAQTIKTKNDQKVWFTQEMRDNLFTMFDLVRKSLILMLDHLEREPDSSGLEAAAELEDQIDIYRTTIRQQHLDEVNHHKYSYAAGSYYNDLITICETIGDHALKVSESLMDKE